MNFQGRLLNAAGAVVADGNYNMQFKLYQDGPGNVVGDTGGTLMWTESWVYGANTPDNRVTVKNGYFSIPLGSICAFTATTCTANTGNAQTNTVVDFNQDTLWLSTNIGNVTTAATFAGASGDGEMLPMRRLSSSVYALNAGKLGGIAAGGFIQNVSPIATQQPANINILSGAASTVAAAQIQAVASATAPVLVVKGGATPGAGGDLLQLQNSAGAVQAKFDSSGNLTAGTITSGLINGQTISATASFTGTVAAAGLITGTLGVNVPTGQTYKINNVDINTAGTLTNVAYENQANTFTTGTNTFSAAGTALAVTNNATIGGTLAVTSTVTGGTYNGQTISAAASFTGTVNTATGYQVAGAATTGNYLRGNGTNFVSSAILAADLPTGSGNYIQNGTTLQASSNFHISGTGSADTSITTPLLDTATAVPLNIGTTNASVINLNENTTVAAGKTFAVGTGATTLGGTLAVTSTVTGGTYNLQTISAAASFTGTVNAATGYQVAGAATTGNYLRGNGTNFVSSAILAADIPTGSGNYIQNGTTLQASSNFHISGTGSADTSITTPLLDTATAVALNVGTNNATQINLNENTTVAANKSFTANGDALFKDATNSATAFQIQNATAVPVLTVDTINQTLTVRGTQSTAPLGATLLTNGDFATNSCASWTCGTGWAAGTGAAVHTTGNTAALSQSITVASGTTYQIDFTTGATAGSLTLAIGSQTESVNWWESPSKSIVANATGAQTFSITPSTDYNGTLDNITIKPITGTALAVQRLLNSDGTVGLEVRSGGSGLDNTFIGVNSGFSNTTGYSNTANGLSALQSNTTGRYNNAIGDSALYSNTTGTYNTANGVSALYSNTTGSYNTANGFYALGVNTTGSNNTANGNYALYSNTTGTSNTANGVAALYSNTTGAYNTAIGGWALQSNTTGFSNTANGRNALYSLKTLTGTISATATNAGNAKFTSTSTTGLVAGLAITISGTTSYNGSQTIASVDDATHFTITTAFSTADAAGLWTTADSNYNTAEGYQAGSGSDVYAATGNSLFGTNTGLALQSGANYNTLMGYSAGSGITTGTQNVLLGYNAGTNLTTGSNNVLIGQGVTAPSATGSNQLQIGVGISGDLSTGTLAVATSVSTPTITTASGDLTIDPVGNTVVKGSTSVTGTAALNVQNSTGSILYARNDGNIGIGTTSPGSNLDVQGTQSTAPLGATLLTNGDFATNSCASWTCGAGWAAGTGAAVHTTGNMAALSQSITVANGTTYQIDFTQTGATAGSLTLAIGSQTQSFTSWESPHKSIVANASGAQTFSITPSTDYNGTLDNITVKPITGTALAVQRLLNSDGTVGLEVRSGGSGLANTFVGVNSGSYNTTGSANTANGYAALLSNTTGSYNTANGISALQSNTTGTNNTASGTAALNNNTTGSFNTASGSYALPSNTTGSFNTASGYAALYSNTTGSFNTTSGFQALNSNTTGSFNTATGNYALQINTTGNYNTASGTAALNNLKTLTGTISATVTNAGKAKFTSTSTTGLVAGLAITISGTTSYNGSRTIQTVDSGTTFTITTAYSTADAAGLWTTADSNYNTAEGYQAGSGSDVYAATGNSLFGTNTGLALQSGANYNTLMGYSAGSGITTGTQNVLLGYNAGTNLTTGSNNVLIGQGVTAPVATGSNQLQIGVGISGDLSIGTLAVKTATNSATAFQIQNSAGTALLTADTTTMTITVQTLIVTANLTVSGNASVTGTVTAGSYSRSCPTGYVTVPGNPKFGTTDFCVMKYDASNDGSGNAVSVPNAAPWVSISQITSEDTSKAAGGHLLTEAEWMTIATNAMNVNSNWCNADGSLCGNAPGTTGKILASGHNDNSPAAALTASATDSEACYGTVTAGVNTACGSTGTQKRTLTLSNGAVIWDIGGNVWQWTDAWIIGNEEPTAATAGFAWREYTAITKFQGLQYVNPTNRGWNSNQGLGQIYSDGTSTNNSQYGFLRGGRWVDGTGAGAFALDLYDAPTGASAPASVGFRVAR